MLGSVRDDVENVMLGSGRGHGLQTILEGLN